MGRTQDKQNTEYITDLRPDDVLFGRGSGPNDHEGNIRFRNLVSQRKAEYLATNHRQTKAKIAKEIVDAVFIKNGRFLKRADPKGAEEYGVPPGVEAWCRVDDETTMEKAKQALRQNREKPSKEEIDAAARKIAIRDAAAKVEAEAAQQQHKGGRGGQDDPYAPLPLDAHGNNMGRHQQHQQQQQQQPPEIGQQQKLLMLQQQQYQVLQQQQQEAKLRRQRQLEIAQQTPEIQQVYTNHYGNNNNPAASAPGVGDSGGSTLHPFQVSSGSHLGGLAAITKAAELQQEHHQHQQQQRQQRHSTASVPVTAPNPERHHMPRHSAPAHSLHDSVSLLDNRQQHELQIPEYISSMQEAQHQLQHQEQHPAHHTEHHPAQHQAQHQAHHPSQHPAQHQQQQQQQVQPNFNNTYGPSRGRRRSSVNMADLCELLGEDDTDDDSDDGNVRPIDLTNISGTRRASIASVKMEDIAALLEADQDQLNPEMLKRRQSIASIASAKMEDFEGELEDLRHGMRRMSTQSMGDVFLNESENLEGSEAAFESVEQYRGMGNHRHTISGHANKSNTTAEQPGKKMKTKRPISTAAAAAAAVQELEQEERAERASRAAAAAAAASEQEQAEMEALLLRQMMSGNSATSSGGTSDKLNISDVTVQTSDSDQLRNEYLLNQLMKETQRQQQLEQQQRQQRQRQQQQHQQQEHSQNHQSMTFNEVFNSPDARKGNNKHAALAPRHRNEKDISDIPEDNAPRPLSLIEKDPDHMNVLGSSSMSVMKTAMVDSGLSVTSEQLNSILDEQQRA